MRHAHVFVIILGVCGIVSVMNQIMVSYSSLLSTSLLESNAIAATHGLPQQQQQQQKQQQQQQQSSIDVNYKGNKKEIKNDNSKIMRILKDDDSKNTVAAAESTTKTAAVVGKLKEKQEQDTNRTGVIVKGETSWFESIPVIVEKNDQVDNQTSTSSSRTSESHSKNDAIGESNTNPLIGVSVSSSLSDKVSVMITDGINNTSDNTTNDNIHNSSNYITQVPPSKHINVSFVNSLSMATLLENGFLLHSKSFCEIAAWTYPQPYFKNETSYCDCPPDLASPYLYNVSHLEAHDTLQVGISVFEKFVNDTLPHIQQPIVLLVGYTELKNPAESLRPEYLQRAVDHPYIQKFFIHSPDFNALSLVQQKHPKLHSLPYGLHFWVFPRYRDMLARLEKEIQKDKLNKTAANTHNTTTTTTNSNNDNIVDIHKQKNTTIFVSSLKLSKRVPNRDHIPNIPRLSKNVYFERMWDSKYVLSPSGDRPECFRHYEAIGMGTIPITELDPEVYSHFGNGNVVYQNHRWNVGKLETELGPQYRQPNRRLIFEEYWMEYIQGVYDRHNDGESESESGEQRQQKRQQLRWWDKAIHERRFFPRIQRRLKGLILPTYRYDRGIRRMVPISEAAIRKRRRNKAEVKESTQDNK